MGIDWNKRYEEMILTGRSGVMTLNMNDGDLQMQKKMKEVVDFPKAEVVVDFGCGSCVYRPFLKTVFKAERYVGYDISEVIVKYLNERFPDDSFVVYPGWICSCDAIWSKSVIQHLPDDEAVLVLKAMKKALMPNGKIYIMDSEVQGATGYYFCRGDIEHFELFRKAGLMCGLSYEIVTDDGIKHNLYEVTA